jgi:hypothetical protein
LAQGRSLLHPSDSVRFLRSFCRADEATGMPLHDPGCVKTSSRLFVSAEFAEAIDEAVH